MERTSTNPPIMMTPPRTTISRVESGMWEKSTNTPPIATAMNATKTTLNDVKAGFVHFNIGTPNPNNKKMIIMPIAVATPDNISPSSMLNLTLSMGIVYVPT